VASFLSKRLSGRLEPTTLLFGGEILSIRLYRQSSLDAMHYSWIIKTFSFVQFTTVHANLIEQTTSSIQLVVLKRRIIVVIRKNSTCLLLHRLEQHRRILLSKETYRTLAQPADSCGNYFGLIDVAFIILLLKNTQPHLKITFEFIRTYRDSLLETARKRL